MDVITNTGSVFPLGLIYRSPNSSNQNNSLLLDIISDICLKTKEKLIIIGDFNLPRINWANMRAPHNSYEDSFLCCLLDNFLYQHVLEPTRIRSGQKENILDLVLTKEEEYIHDLDFMNPVGKSDHLVLRIVLNEPIKHLVTCQKKKYNMYKGDYEGMRGELQTYNWDEYFRVKSTNQCWELLRDVILNLQEDFIPVTKPVINLKPGWMNKDVHVAYKGKQKAWRKYKVCRTDENYLIYKQARNRLKQLIKRARKEFELKIVQEIKATPRSFWKYVSKKTKQTTRICRIRTTDGHLTQTNTDAAECLNSYFSTVFTDSTPGISLGNKTTKGECLSDFKFEEPEILKVLDNLKIDNAAGPDGIHPRTLFETKSHLAKPLRILFQKSLNTSTVPIDWKKATVVPIFKKGRKDLPQNYRPVSLTCIICKVMEKLIRDEIMSFLLRNNVLSDRQFGFVPGRSCTLRLLVCIEEWSKQLDEGNNVDIIYTDFSKAFDRVPHWNLMEKVSSLGIKDKVGGWLTDFLTDRFQRVRIEDSNSSWTLVRSGVPQGSVLGPVLFLLYINDLPNALEDNSIKLFADDAKLDNSITCDEDTVSLQRNLNNMVDWSEKWSLTLNTNKCKVLHLSRSANAKKQSYYMMNPDGAIILEEVHHEKDLGVYIDSNLSFEVHVNKAVLTANKITGIIKRNFKYMGEEIFLNLYKTLVRPYLEYSSVVWDPITLRDQRMIEGVQRRGTKLIPDMEDLNYEQRLTKLGLPSLQYRRVRADMIQVFKIVTGLDRINSKLFFEFAHDSKTRGHKYKLQKPRYRTNLRGHCFSNRIVDVWNSLSSYVIEAPDLNSFKSRLNTFWKNHPLKFTPSFY